MTSNEAIEYISSYGWSQWKLGLGRTHELLNRLDNPHKGLKFVHVAGTNGKGSTCAMLEAVLRHAGYKTGFYPSPYIENFRERIQYCGEMISESDLARITEKVAYAADSMTEHPTQFELITAIGMLYFAEKKCDIVVLEVGLGGTFDSTNVIDPPEAAVICNIGLDHTNYLGNTVEEIARCKCGIIKCGSSVACYENIPSVIKIIEDTCLANNCPLYKAENEKLNFKLSLKGPHQKKNARTALAAIHALRDRGWKITDADIENGLANTVWPARFEILNEDPPFILDGGHNPQCAEALRDALCEYLSGKKILFIIGMLADKDYKKVLDIIMPLAESFITVTPANPRALSGSELASVIKEKGGNAFFAGNVDEAVKSALKSKKPVCAFGSLYMAGELRPAFRKITGKGNG